MEFYIPTYEECLEIIDENPQMYFYERKYNIDNYKLSIFGYRYAQYNNFMIPLFSKPDVNALELKGLSFVFNDDDSVFKHYVMLHKFWELDQYEHSKYDLFKDKKIKNITTKEDGFQITYIMLPSGDIVSQTKKGYDCYQNHLANEYLGKPNYYEFIRDCLLNNIQPLFELVGEKLQVEYHEPNLILTKLRCNKTGKYLNIDDYKTKYITVVEQYDNEYTLDDLLELKKDVERCEGWIVHFEDDTILKIKTDWWINEKNKINF